MNLAHSVDIDRHAFHACLDLQGKELGIVARLMQVPPWNHRAGWAVGPVLVDKVDAQSWQHYLLPSS
jgi:hypothetical protein